MTIVLIFPSGRSERIEGEWVPAAGDSVRWDGKGWSVDGIVHDLDHRSHVINVYLSGG